MNEPREQMRRIEVEPGLEVSSDWRFPAGFRGGTAVVLAHGAGGDLNNPLLVVLQRLLANAGHLAVTFNFPYAEAGRRSPDPPGRLESTWRAVLAAVRDDPDLAPARVVAGGKSMGGRMASQVAAAGAPVDALLLLGYPLHPAGRPDERRIAHFPRVTVPSLFVQGTRDALCGIDLLQEALGGLGGPWRLHVVADGDHSFRVTRRSGRSEAEVWEEIGGAVLEWVRGL